MSNRRPPGVSHEGSEDFYWSGGEPGHGLDLGDDFYYSPEQSEEEYYEEEPQHYQRRTRRASRHSHDHTPVPFGLIFGAIGALLIGMAGCAAIIF